MRKKTEGKTVLQRMSSYERHYFDRAVRTCEERYKIDGPDDYLELVKKKLIEMELRETHDIDGQLFKVLKEAGVNNFLDLYQMSYEQLIEIKGIGSRRLVDVRRALFRAASVVAVWYLQDKKSGVEPYLRNSILFYD